MSCNKKLFILVPALVLISLLLILTPLKLVNKMARAIPPAQSQSKHGCSYKNCFSQSLISPNYFDAGTGYAKSSYPEVSYFLKDLNVLPESFHSIIDISSIPLRC